MGTGTGTGTGTGLRSAKVGADGFVAAELEFGDAFSRCLAALFAVARVAVVVRFAGHVEASDARNAGSFGATVLAPGATFSVARAFAAQVGLALLRGDAGFAFGVR